MSTAHSALGGDARFGFRSTRSTIHPAAKRLARRALAAAERLEGRTLLAAVTGDGFGYVADAADYEAIDLSPTDAGVVPLLGNVFDYGAELLDLGGNTFNFYGETYDALFVHTNGTISFGQENGYYWPTDLSYPEAPIIAPLWDGWATNFDADDQVLAKFEDTDAEPGADRLVVEWSVVHHVYEQYEGVTAESPVTFQAILSLNTGAAAGDVVFNYPDVDTGNYHSDGGTAAVGIKDAGYQGGNRLLVSYYPYYYGPTGLVGSGQAVRVFWAGNDAPVADAGPGFGGTYSVPAGYPVWLDASATLDAQQPGYTLTYEWDFDEDGLFGEYEWDGGMRGSEVGVSAVFESRGLAEGTVATVSLRVTDGGGLSGTDTADILVTHNQDPVAAAIPPFWEEYTVVEGRSVQVVGDYSYDPEGFGIPWENFQWDFDADNVLGEYSWDGGDNGDEVGVYTYFTTGGLRAGESREILLRVTDYGGADDTAGAVVRVVANQAPVAEAGPPGGGTYFATAGGYTQLYGYESYDPDEPLGWDAFQWDLDGDEVYGETTWNGGDPKHGDEIGPNPTFFAAGLEAGTVATVSLRVTDSAGQASTDTATVEVRPNQRPVAEAGPPSWYGGDYTVLEGQGLSLWGYDSFDPDFEGLVFEWDLDNDGVFGEAWWNGGTASRGDETGPQPYFIASGINGPTDYTVTLRVTDPGGLSAEDTAVIHVLGSEPRAVIRGTPATSPEGTAITFESTAFNAAPGSTYAWAVTRDDDPAPYAAGTLPSFSFVPIDDGNYRVTLVVTEPNGDASPLTSDNDVTITVTNAAPVLQGVAVDAPSVNEGGAVTLTGTYNDLGALDGHAVTIDWGDGQTETLSLGPIGANLPLAAPRQFNGHTYYAIDSGLMTWEQAEAEALRLGGRLVAIGDADENRFVTDYARFVFGDQPVWIGLNDADSEGTFAWSSGEAVAYTNWYPSEPNDARVFGGEDYAELRTYARNADGGMWNDLPVGGTLGSRVRGAVIEFDAPVSGAAPAFAATHTYADDSGAGAYAITVTLADDDGAAAVDPRGGVTWAEDAGGNGHYYLLTSGSMLWDDAEAQAVALGGHLVSVGGPDETDFLVANFFSGRYEFTGMWMGLTDSDVEGDWRWTSGVPLDYTNWAPNEPNNDGGEGTGGQDYGVINFAASPTFKGRWDDDGRRDHDRRFIGVIELPSAPEGAGRVSVTVTNAGPAITAASSDAAAVGDAVPGETVNVWADFTDAGAADTHTLGVDWGDGHTTSGTVDQVLGRAAAGHAYAQGGIYTAVLTITDDDGGVATRSLTVYVSGSGIHNGELQIVGTGGADALTIKRLDTGGLALEGAAALSARIAASAVPQIRTIRLMLGAGDDRVTVVSANLVPVFIDGGAGNDHLNGGNGPAVLVGGDGDDMLIGGSNRDLLIGGRGADRLVGNGGDDVLIAGTTAHDADPAALRRLAEAWGGSLPFAERVALLKGGVGGASLSLASVSDDTAADVLTGAAGSDWFLFNGGAGKSAATDAIATDLVTQVGTA